MLILHLGLHKTGSSSIQLALHTAPKLSSRVSLPQPGRPQTTESYRARLTSLQASTVDIFSDEGVLGHPSDGYVDAASRLALIQSVIESQSAKVFVYFRQTVDWLSSVYLQEVQEGKLIDPTNFWELTRHHDLIHWDIFLELLEDCISPEQLQIRLFKPQDDVVSDFFANAQLGDPPYVGKRGIRANQSIAAIHAPILRAMNEHDSANPELITARRVFFQQVLAASSPSKLSPFPESLQLEMGNYYQASWNRLTEMMLRRDSQQGARFRDSASAFSREPMPFAGADLGDAAIQAEMLRILDLLAQTKVSEPDSLMARAARMLINDRSAILPSTRRKLHFLIRRNVTRK